MTRCDAVRILENEVNQIDDLVTQAKTLHDVIQMDYFESHPRMTEDDKLMINYEHGRYRILNSILGDIIDRLDAAVSEMNKHPTEIQAC